jgi:hypothetical protein
MDIFLQAVGCISLVSMAFLAGGVAWTALLRTTRMVELAEERLAAMSAAIESLQEQVDREAAFSRTSLKDLVQAIDEAERVLSTLQRDPLAWQVRPDD